jgi:hypothetical protein
MDWLNSLVEGDLTAALIALVIGLVALVLGELAQRMVKNRSLKFLLWAGAGAAVAGGVALALSAQLSHANARFTGMAQHMFLAGRGDPIIVGVYPSDAFGPLHRDGLHAGLAPYAQQIRIVDLEAPYVDMKNDDAPQVLARLRQLLVTENVIAVVGPPAVFITSATSRAAAGWDDTRVPVFRINSGVDERAREFVDLARSAVARDAPLVFLVETNLNSDRPTYGQILFDAIADQIPEWSQWVREGRITRRSFQRGAIAQEIERWGPDAFLGRRQLIMLLGVGSDYRAVVEQFYRAYHPQRHAVLGGWMNAYDAEPSYMTDVYQWAAMFEVTDIHLNSEQNDETRRQFESEFAAPSPALRDQAFSFDAAGLIAATFLETMHDRPLSDLQVNEAFLTRFAAALAARRQYGVTGEIVFAENGQNAGSPNRQLMTYAQYRGRGEGWVELDGPEAVVALFDAPAAAPVNAAP